MWSSDTYYYYGIAACDLHLSAQPLWRLVCNASYMDSAQRPGRQPRFQSSCERRQTTPVTYSIAGTVTLPKTGGVVTAVLTDNGSSMVAAWKMTGKELPAFGGGYATYVFSLMLVEVLSGTKFISDVRGGAFNFCRLVRDFIGLLKEFRNLQDPMIMSNVVHRSLATRWYYQHSCLKSVLHIRHVLDGLYRAQRHKAFGNRFSGGKIGCEGNILAQTYTRGCLD
ncbi:hypothetical protein GQ600_20003 [Phytophthora cactorum]|nr:hypothetical protein GQ600_20003 [Phytophthora cactorum]